ncbi:glycosyltransferase family 32 protein [Endozoicomonas arenosclerae]|uniref:glycosyltransferase family 32 protein n=1 Tax=Endozoicomonas arenosclerae TaxID=1633495 RepID=UPI00078640DB|nr:glycosyltransferase [Endozoicomonas arenosclerae]
MHTKTIHYCWFGGPLPKQEQSYIKEWKKIFPDYEISHWNENNIPRGHPYLESMLKARNWAFLADYVRLHALYYYGGIYFDTDIEVKQSFQHELNNDVSCLFGFESDESHNRCYVGTAVIAAKKQAPFIKFFMEQYDIKLAKRVLRKDHLTGPKLLTRLLQEKGLTQAVTQKLGDIKLLNRAFMYPDPTKPDEIAHCYTVHHEAGSWVPASRSMTLTEKFFKKKRKLSEWLLNTLRTRS